MGPGTLRDRFEEVVSEEANTCAIFVPEHSGTVGFLLHFLLPLLQFPSDSQ